MAKAIRFVRDEIAITESNRPDEMIIIFSGGVTLPQTRALALGGETPIIKLVM